MPREPSSLVLAITTKTSVSPAPEIKTLVPERRYTSPSRFAVVRSDAASEPAPGSVKQYDASLSPDVKPGHHVSTTDAWQYLPIMADAMLWMVRKAAVVVQPLANSSTIKLASRRVMPRPPAASGTIIPMNPKPPAAFNASFGKIAAWSHCAA